MNNKKAYFDYNILQEFTAGVALQGSEVKSLREGQCNLEGAYCYINNGEVFVKGMHIKPYENACTETDPYRERKLLLTKREIAKIGRELENVGITLVPLNVIVGRTVKVKIGLAKGKKNYDKRETIKARDIERENKRADI